MSTFNNIKIWKPETLEELTAGFKEFIYSDYPYYLNLSKKILNHENSL